MPPAPACAVDVAAQTRPGAPLSFTTGWVRLALAPCPGAASGPAGVLQVLGSDRELVFSPGRPGGATAGVLTGTERAASSPSQVFTLPPDTSGHDVVLAPWPSASAPPRIAQLRLLAPP